MTRPGPTGQHRIGIDVGGTFTDFVLSPGGDGRLFHHKEASTPGDPSLAVERGIRALLDSAQLPPSAIGLVVHGTTIALNTVIQRKGAKLALVVSKGNRDVLEIARCRMPNSYNFFLSKEVPLVPRDLVFEVEARMLSDGSVRQGADAAELDDLAARLAAAEVEAVAVMLLNAYVDPGLEEEVASGLEQRLSGVLVTRSAGVWPEIREYERAMAATLNAYVHPLMDQYLSLCLRRLQDLGIEAPLYITTSNGGTISLDSARARPIETLLSGPASGVVAASRALRASEQANAITFDMGGTSSDIALIVEGEPGYTTRTDIGDMPLMLPVVNVVSIGAGGGSLLWVDEFGLLKVGPDSAGALPGPICYGQGGTQATITDCYLVLGYLDPDSFLDGRMRLDRAGAEAALEEIGQAIGLEGPDSAARAAEAALRIATAKMATELFKMLAQNGLDPAALSLVPFGGAGPVQANLLAAEAKLDRVLVPPAAGTFCAFGALIADVKRDFVRSLRERLEQSGGRALQGHFEEMERDAGAWIAGEGALLSHTRIERHVDARYSGQAFDLKVPVDQSADQAAIIESFHREHERFYEFRDTESAVEVTSARVRAVGEVSPIALPRLAGSETPPPSFGTRRVFHRGAWIEAALYRRSALAAGQRIEGPGIVEQGDSTLWVIPGWTAVAEPSGNILIERQ